MIDLCQYAKDLFREPHDELAALSDEVAEPMSGIPRRDQDGANWDATHFKAVMGHFASGITIIASQLDDRPIGLTCQSFFSVSIDPPLVALSVAKTSTTYPLIRQAGGFSINILHESQRALSDAFAQQGGDKWLGVEWNLSPYGVPRIEGVPAWIACDTWAEFDAGDHTIVVGRVLDLDADPLGRPLLFYRGRYVSLDPNGTAN